MAIEQPATSSGAAAYYSQTFDGRPENVAAVRAFTAAVLASFPRCEDAVLLANELAVNSVTHSLSGAGGKFAVDIAVFAGPEPAVRIYVADEGGETSPHVVPPEGRVDSGRGLAMVETLSSMWGYLSSDNGATTWCELTTAV